LQFSHSDKSELRLKFRPQIESGILARRVGHESFGWFRCSRKSAQPAEYSRSLTAL